jgi:hypothetical protein
MTHICVARAVIGPGHVQSDRPCEDSFATVPSGDGGWVSAVVCDGCGSAAHALEGAEFISDFVSAQLVTMAAEIARRGPGEWLVDAIVRILAELREVMRREFGEDIADYAATIVGAMVSRNGGFILHVGDGIASSFALSDGTGGLEITLVDQSDPKNGEYANETFYVTDRDWIKNVRITPVHGTDCLLLCSDGAQPLFYNRDSPSPERVAWLLGQLRHAGVAGAGRRLQEILQDGKARKLSSDDKTVLLLIAEEAWEQIGRAIGATPDTAAAMGNQRHPSEPRVRGPRVERPRAALGGDARTEPKRDRPARDRRPDGNDRAASGRSLRGVVLISLAVGLGAGTALGYGATAYLPGFFASEAGRAPDETPGANPWRYEPTIRQCNPDNNYRPEDL